MKYIGDILEENFKDGHIDFMSVDVEGMGARIVNAIDFNWYDIDVILLEMDFNKEESRKLYMNWDIPQDIEELEQERIFFSLKQMFLMQVC